MNLVKAFFIVISGWVTASSLLFAMEPVYPNNPYIQLRNQAGDVVWINKDHLDQLLVISKRPPLPVLEPGVLSFNYSQQLLNIFADLLIMFQSFNLQNDKVTAKIFPLFTQDLRPIFIDDVRFGSQALIYNYISGVIQNMAPEAVDKLLNMMQYFPFPYKIASLWAVIKSPPHKSFFSSALFAHWPEETKTYITYMQRYAYPPENSVFNKFIVNNEPFPIDFDPMPGELITVRISLDKKNIDSIFGLGALLRKIQYFASRHYERSKCSFHIDLSENKVSIIDQADAVELEPSEEMISYLDISDNELKEISPRFISKASNMQELYLDNNKLKFLPDQFLKNARMLNLLDLSHNSLSALPDNFLSDSLSLVTLLIINNDLTRLDDGFLKNKKNLRRLDVSYNRNLKLSEDFLSDDFPNLRTVALEACDLELLPNTFLQNSPIITHVNLKRNKLSSLPQGLLQSTSIRSLLIEGNPVANDEQYLSQLPNLIRITLLMPTFDSDEEPEAEEEFEAAEDEE